jgi:NAD(P)-dependent dehydrogenase (short-subunit alcohol dehydrogenase family)
VSVKAIDSQEYTARFRLDGRVALITGAGRGLGRSIACSFALAGAEVYLLARSSAEIGVVAEEIRALGYSAQAVVCDVTDPASVRDVISALPGLDILVNNAGTSIPEPFLDFNTASLDLMINLNVRAVFLVSQAAARKMLEAADRKTRGGVIINISSQMGHVGAPTRTGYCMTKHAVEGFTKALGVELAPYNIRVNSIAPTFLDTPMTAPALARPEFSKWVLDRIPLGRIGQLEEVASATVFVASGAASLMTGTSLILDGGWTAQ